MAQRLVRDIEAKEGLAQAASTLVDTGDHLLSSFKVYHNVRRSQALRVCGWFDTLTAYHCSFCALQPLSMSAAAQAQSSQPTTTTTTHRLSASNAPPSSTTTNKLLSTLVRHKVLDFDSHNSTETNPTATTTAGAGAGGSGSESTSRHSSTNDLRSAGVAARWTALSKRELKNLEVALNGHEQHSEFEKAAALALFHLDMNRALTGKSRRCAEAGCFVLLCCCVVVLLCCVLCVVCCVLCVVHLPID